MRRLWPSRTAQAGDPRISRSRVVRAQQDLRVVLALLADGEVARAGEVAARALQWLSRGGRLPLDAPSARQFASVFQVLVAGTAAVAAAAAEAA